MIWNLDHPHTGNACKISDLENRSAHAQMAWSQKFGKSEISLDTGFALRQRLNFWRTKYTRYSQKVSLGSFGG